ncbi:gamma-secretase subunit APH-1B isoform X2 [Myotis lucifugus]|uniref:gamma-secretase subunit APH-1B isoform X2 n=1 Tax=Myotis lucifugus TaxID=59463 RepID=UPI000CCC4878|nr:gamma-secretase subunit APH-1B isoform X2 [Myotis lucifugus]
MTAAVFFGCAFIAFGPALALYIFTIATDPLRIIFLIVGKANEGLKTINPDEPAPSMRLLAYAFMTQVIILLHMFWGIIFFDGCEKKNWYPLLAVILTHLLVSALTFLNPQYEISLVSAYMIMVLTGIWAFFVAGGSRRSLKRYLLCQDKNFLLYSQRSR